ncbi:MAG: gamma-butyrobetaine hydroxylase-like domain-containing protein [Ignavibacteriaceae bacterium]
MFSERQSTISSIKEIGNYAISISWKDGHNTGIYEFPFLKNLSEY